MKAHLNDLSHTESRGQVLFVCQDQQAGSNQLFFFQQAQQLVFAVLHRSSYVTPQGYEAMNLSHLVSSLTAWHNDRIVLATGKAANKHGLL